MNDLDPVFLQTPNTLDKVKELFPNISSDVLSANGFPTPNAKNGVKVKRLPVGDTSGRSGKYNAVRTEYNGTSYASKKEAQTAEGLDFQKKEGWFDFYLRQVNFPLPGGIVYKADFVTFKTLKDTTYNLNPVMVVKVIEVKGFATATWKMKLKLFQETYPNLEIVIV